MLPGALIVVIAGILINELFKVTSPSLVIAGNTWLNCQPLLLLMNFSVSFSFPDFSGFSQPAVWITAATIAIVASIETLLCLEAGDKMDPMKRYSSANTELKAQGIGNALAGLLGGLPMTSVIVRTTANVNAGAKTKLSAIAHGVFLLIAVVAIPGLVKQNANGLPRCYFNYDRFKTGKPQSV